MVKELFTPDNWLAVIVSTVVFFILGAIWYGVLGKTWMEANGLTKEKIQAGSKMIYPMNFIMEFIMVLLLAGILRSCGVMKATDGVTYGFLIGLIFSGFTSIINSMYAMRDKRLYWIDAGYMTIGFTLAGLILSCWH